MYGLIIFYNWDQTKTQQNKQQQERTNQSIDQRNKQKTGQVKCLEIPKANTQL